MDESELQPEGRFTNPGSGPADCAGSSQIGAGDSHESRGREGSHPPSPPKGGPRTAQGKKESAKNARRHGILSPDPTAGGESSGDYEALLEGLRAHFQPVGLYEEELTAQATNELWGLHRVTRQISAAIDLRNDRVDPPPPVTFSKPHLQRVSWSAYKRPFEAQFDLERLDMYPDEWVVGPEITNDAVRAIEDAGFQIPAVDPGPFVSHSVGYIREVLSKTAGGHDIEVAEVIKHAASILEHVSNLAMGAEGRLKEIRARQSRRAERAATSHLPDLDEYERHLRYKRTHERSFEKWIALLEASQRARSGALDPPIRIQVSEG